MFSINRLRLFSMAITCGMLSFTIGCTKTIYNVNPGEEGNGSSLQDPSSLDGSSTTDSNTSVACVICLEDQVDFSLLLCPRGINAMNNKHPVCMDCAKKILKKDDKDLFFPCPTCREPIASIDLIEVFICSGDKNPELCAVIAEHTKNYFEDVIKNLSPTYLNNVLRISNMLLKNNYIYTWSADIKDLLVNICEIENNGRLSKRQSLINIAIEEGYEAIGKWLIETECGSKL